MMTGSPFPFSAILIALACGMPGLVGSSDLWGAEPAPRAVYRFDPAHSSIAFRIGHYLAKVPGQFTAFTGTINLDEAQPENTTVNAEIETASIDTANTARDKHLRNKDFFDSDNNPLIVFKSRTVQRTGETTADVNGDLTLNGVTKPITLKVTFVGKRPDNRSPQIARTAWHATARLKRSDYGLRWNGFVEGVSGIGDTVDVTLSIEAVQQTP